MKTININGYIYSGWVSIIKGLQENGKLPLQRFRIFRNGAADYAQFTPQGELSDASVFVKGTFSCIAPILFKKKGEMSKYTLAEVVRIIASKTT